MTRFYPTRESRKLGVLMNDKGEAWVAIHYSPEEARALAKRRPA